MNLENMLCEIDPNRRNLHGGRLLSMDVRTTILWHTDAGSGGRPPHQVSTDHGHGSVYWVLGGGLKGGRVAGEQVAVTQTSLFRNRDYPVLTDYRALMSGLFRKMYGLDQAASQRVFASVTPRDLALL